jgi:hypothetical protein
MGADGYPAVDYSDYAPSFRVDDKTYKLSATVWPGEIDAKGMHEFIHALPGDAETLVCVNVGTGRPIDAAEWVRWANKKNALQRALLGARQRARLRLGSRPRPPRRRHAQRRNVRPAIQRIRPSDESRRSHH